jgi:hypothetical protein
MGALIGAVSYFVLAEHVHRQRGERLALDRKRRLDRLALGVMQADVLQHYGEPLGAARHQRIDEDRRVRVRRLVPRFGIG